MPTAVRGEQGGARSAMLYRKAKLGWEAKTDLETLIKMMVDADVARVARE